MTTEGKTLWRVFCAIELPDEVRARVAEHGARLREAFPRVRASWERAEKMHLTVKFVGEIEEARVGALGRAAERAAAGLTPFALSVGGTGAFPERGPARVLWLGVGDEGGGLARLQRRLEDECAAEGFPREARAFHPHLTVARLREPRDARALVERHRATRFEPQTFQASELVVLRSELGPGGSRYTPVTKHRFA